MFLWEKEPLADQLETKSRICLVSLSSLLKTLLDPRFAKFPWIWVRPSIRASVPTFIIYHSIFLRISSFAFCFVFLIFCMKLRNHKHPKLTEPHFLRKFLLVQKRSCQKSQIDPICPFVRYYSIFLRTGSLVFLMFCIKLRDHKYSNLTMTSAFSFSIQMLLLHV